MLVIPVPLQAPPGSTAESVTGASFSQKGPAAVIVASQAVGLQAGRLANPLIIIKLPKLSVTLSVSIPGGGVIVEPVVNVVQKPGALQEFSGIGNGL